MNSLKSNLPKSIEVDAKYVAEYHQILDQLQNSSGSDLSGFRIPANELQAAVSGGNYLTGQIDCSGREVCERAYLMMKIDGVLGFFNLKMSAKRPDIGFSPVT